MMGVGTDVLLDDKDDPMINVLKRTPCFTLRESRTPNEKRIESEMWKVDRKGKEGRRTFSLKQLQHFAQSITKCYMIDAVCSVILLNKRTI